jgi:hypothetical protein
MKIAQKIAIFWATQSFKKSLWAFKSSPIGKKLPNLVTLRKCLNLPFFDI